MTCNRRCRFLMWALSALAVAAFLAALAGCTPEQRKHWAVCRFIAGEWVCPATMPADANKEN